jgi:hypothetical protein
MLRRMIGAITLCVLATATVLAQPSLPIRLHPENSHYFSWQDEPTILITSGEHYGALLNLDFDFVRYFEELASHGLNHTRTFSGVYRENQSAFGITDNPLAPKPLRYICPWRRSNVPGYKDGGNKFDLEKWDAGYFQRLHAFMKEAQKKGIVVEFTLFCPMYNDALWEVCPMNVNNNVNGVGDCPREEVYTLKHSDLLAIHLAVTRKIVHELRDYGNLYYEICNEPYFGGVQMDWQHKVIDTIVATEKDASHRHLISLNIANGRKKVIDPHPDVSIFNFHYCVPPDVVEMNYDLNKVIGENETGFRGSADVLYRTEAWDFLLAGGGLYNNLDYSFTAQHPSGTLRDYKSPGGGSRELRQQLKILKNFLYGFEFTKMKPDRSFIESTSPKLTTSVLADAEGLAYAIYLHVPLPVKPKNLEDHLRKGVSAELTVNLPAASYQAEWIDTKSGSMVKQRRFQHQGGKHRLVSPEFDNDIALRIIRENK